MHQKTYRQSPSTSVSRSEGGDEGEKLARQRFLEEKDANEKENMRVLQAARAESFRKVCKVDFGTFGEQAVILVFGRRHVAS